MKFLFALLILLVPTLAVSQAIARSSSLTNVVVVAVDDGDSIRISQNGRVSSIRMACIDAPELDQPQGPQSANRLRQILPRNASVQFRITSTNDRYNRLVAEVYRNGVSVNMQMVQEGRAAVDRRLLYGCLANRDRYLAVEQTARQRRLGFWSLPDPLLSLGRPDTPPRTYERIYRECTPSPDSSCPESGLQVFETVFCDPEWDEQCPETGRMNVEVTNFVKAFQKK